MDFKQLRSFIAVADYGSFTRAAERLYTSQPTVSAHVRQLEEELKERLFLRTTKSLEITPKGRELYDYAVHVLSLHESLISRWAQEENTIRIGASTIPSAYILPELLPAFRSAHPQTAFSIFQGVSQTVLNGLAEGRFNLGFVGMKAPDMPFSFFPFFTDTMVLITPNTPFFRQFNGHIPDFPALLTSQPLLLREEGSGSGKAVDTFLAASGLQPQDLQVAARLNNQESVKNLVAAGLGISMVSQKAAETAVTEGKLLAFPVPGGGVHRSLYLACRKGGQLKPQLQKFLDFTKEFYGKT